MRATKTNRRQAVADLKRGLILDAAKAVFQREGLDGASLRSIAAEAGYTPAALYFHFSTKEDIYAAVLDGSLRALEEAIAAAVLKARPPDARLRAAALGFFDYYAANPCDLDLGFYLFRGGMKPAGLGQARDRALNSALEAALRPLSDAARDLGASPEEADLLMLDVFAHATGLLLLLHTGRIRMFGASAKQRMQDYVEHLIAALQAPRG